MFLYADDIVLLSSGTRDLKTMFDVLHNWCLHWGLIVNSDKRPKGRKVSKFPFHCGNSNICIVNK